MLVAFREGECDDYDTSASSDQTVQRGMSSLFKEDEAGRATFGLTGNTCVQSFKYVCAIVSGTY